MTSYLMAFCLMFIVDLLYAKYTLYTQARKAVAAGVMAALIILLSGWVIAEYVKDFSVIIFAMAGAFAGTYVGVRK